MNSGYALSFTASSILFFFPFFGGGGVFNWGEFFFFFFTFFRAWFFKIILGNFLFLVDCLSLFFFYWASFFNKGLLVNLYKFMFSTSTKYNREKLKCLLSSLYLFSILLLFYPPTKRTLRELRSIWETVGRGGLQIMLPIRLQVGQWS